MVTLKVGLAIWYHDIHLDTDSHFEVSWGWDGDIILTRSRISHHSLGTSSAPVWANFEQKWYAYHKSKQSMRSVQPKLCNSFMLCIYTYTKKKKQQKAVHKISSACNSLPITIYFSPQRSVWLSHNHSTSPRLDWATTLQAWHQCASANIKWAPSQARAGKAADGNCWQLMACVYWNQFFILFTVR